MDRWTHLVISYNILIKYLKRLFTSSKSDNSLGNKIFLNWLSKILLVQIRALKQCLQCQLFYVKI